MRRTTGKRMRELAPPLQEARARQKLDDLADKVALLEKHYDVRFDRLEERMSTLIRAVWMQCARNDNPSVPELERDNGLL